MPESSRDRVDIVTEGPKDEKARTTILDRIGSFQKQLEGQVPSQLQDAMRRAREAEAVSHQLDNGGKLTEAASAYIGSVLKGGNLSQHQDVQKYFQSRTSGLPYDGNERPNQLNYWIKTDISHAVAPAKAELKKARGMEDLFKRLCAYDRVAGVLGQVGLNVKPWERVSLPADFMDAILPAPTGREADKAAQWKRRQVLIDYLSRAQKEERGLN